MQYLTDEQDEDPTPKIIAILMALLGVARTMQEVMIELMDNNS